MMSRSRRNALFILIGSLAVGGAILGAGVQGRLALPDVVADVLPGAAPVTVTLASSVTKARWLQAAVAAFGAADIRTAAGHPIRIELSNVLSGESMLGIAEGTLQPTVWSPGEGAWVDQLTERWDRTHTRPVASQDCAPTVLTPVGLAMWRPMAEALGWPADPISWAELVDLANDPDGWARHGHPEWGRLRLGHTHPQYSSAGLLFLASVIYATLGRTDGVTEQDVYSPGVTEAMGILAQNTAKYGMVTTDLLNNMARGGPAFLHVASAFEEGTVRFNVERGDELRWPLAFVFPQDGTFWSDHPYCILDGAGWVGPEQAEAAELFRDFLLSPAMQAEAGAHFIRPLDPAAPLGPLLTTVNGTDPAAGPQTVPAFAIPSPEVSEAIIDQFLTTKRKATVLLVLDISGSMEGSAIRSATEATVGFLARLDPRDRVGLLVFDEEIRLSEAIGPVSGIVEQAQDRVQSLVAGGGTNLHGAICRATELLAAEQAQDAAASDSRLYGIVLLSDGSDTTGEISEGRMLATCLGAAEGEEPPRMFIISYGSGADAALLDRLATETRGAVFAADPASIGQAYLRISAEQ